MIPAQRTFIRRTLFLLVFFWSLATVCYATIDGVSGTSFDFQVKAGHISTPDGGSVLFWGYANGGQTPQYPGPTLILNQGDSITIRLTNTLQMPVSIVFPGQSDVQADGGVQGLITNEALSADDPGTPGDESAVTYTFTASHAGTYLYHSGTRPELQVEMGLVGAIIVRPPGFDSANPRAYSHPDTGYDREYLFLLTEMDPRIHRLVEIQGVDALENTDYLSRYFPNYWFINGRSAPDTMLPAFSGWLPNQPYNCLPRMHPGDKVLMRVVTGGRDLHPYHHHGSHSRIIARDGRMLKSGPGSGPDLGYSVFTIKSIPGETVDAIFEWTGKNMGWDIYGTGPGFEHECIDTTGDGFDDSTREYCPDHGRPLPVVLPENQDLGVGDFFSGSPYLGYFGNLPPGQGTLNVNGGFFYMWHSHNEKEMLNFDIFPGGMMTMMIIEAPDVPIQ